jgi:hypothetical protein
MRGYLFILLVGLALGYAWGFRDAHAGRPSVAVRAVNSLGVDRVRRANASYQQAMLDTTR